MKIFCSQRIIRCVLGLCCLLLTATVTAQHTISGTVRSRSGKPISAIAVMLKNSKGLVVAFDESDKTGRYTITFSDSIPQNGLLLEVNWLGYKKTEQPLQQGVNEYPLVLEEKIIELKEVMVKSKAPLVLKMDTLRFDVDAFSEKEDRSIGDVMKHLPGVFVDDDGKISFNGKDITSLLIDDDDLMGGRYGLATKTITKDMIKRIDVLLNHQPVRVLQNKVSSSSISINLVLKDEHSFRTSGQAMLGIGTPGLYQAELSAMMLNRRIKMLNSLKANNTGIDYHSEFQKFGSQDFLHPVDNQRPSELLSDGIVGAPDIPKRNYYRNHSAVLNLNNLYNTKDTLQLRMNLQMFTDRNDLVYASRSDYFLPNDTVHYYNSQSAVLKPFLINTTITAFANKTKFLLNESMSVNLSGYENNSTLDFNGKSFSQQLYARTYDVSNDLQFTPAMRGNNIGNVRWYLGYYNTPQRLTIGTGIDSALLNNSNGYAGITQTSRIPSWVSEVSVYYSLIGSHKVKKTFHAGLLNEKQQLRSSLMLTQNNQTVTPYTGDAGNDLQWRRDKLYGDVMLSMDTKNLNASVKAPVSLQRIRYFQDDYKLDVEHRYVFVNPTLNIKYYLNAEDFVDAAYQYTNKLGNIAGVYRGLILSNYLFITASDADLQSRSQSTASVGYNFKRTPAMFFMNVGAGYTNTVANSILSTVLTNDVQRTVLLPYENSQQGLSLNAGMSKYFFALRTKLSVNASWNKSQYNQFVNGQRFPFSNYAQTLTVGVQTRFKDRVNIDYSGNGTWSTSKPTDAKGNVLTSRFKRFDQRVLLGYTPRGGWYITAITSNVFVQREGMNNLVYWFADANARYRISRWRTDVELTLTNLFNVQEYKTATLNSNQYTFSSYALRGRMALVKFTFNL